MIAAGLPLGPCRAAVAGLIVTVNSVIMTG